MARSIVPITDNEFTRPSPCLGCHWDIQKIDKRRCLSICQRLSAYQDNKEYSHLPHPDIIELQSPDNDDNDDKDIKQECDICEEEDIDESAEIVFGSEPKTQPKNKQQDIKSSRRSQKTKKTGDDMPELSKTSYSANKPKRKICVICGDPNRKIINKKSQTCSRCYQSLKKGAVKMPVRDDINEIVENIANKFERKTKQKPKEVPLTSEKKEEPLLKKPQNRNRKSKEIVRLYLAQYDDIREFLFAEAKRMGVPIKHTAKQLLSEAITARKEKEKMKEAKNEH